MGVLEAEIKSLQKRVGISMDLNYFGISVPVLSDITNPGELLYFCAPIEVDMKTNL